MTPFDPDSPFILRAVYLLESVAGIPVMKTLTDHTCHIQNILGLSSLDLNELLNSWISGKQWLSPSWRNLLLIVRLLDEDELAQRIKTSISAGATEEPLTLEGEPHALKREVKEEAVPMNKAETTSAQPTTGMSSHSITAIVCGASYTCPQPPGTCVV